MQKVFKIILVVNLIAIDVIAVYLYFNSGRFIPVQSENADNSRIIGRGVYPQVQDGCGPDCQKYIDDKISKLNVKITPSAIPVKPQETTKAQPTRAKVRSVSYFPLPGNGNTTNTDWTTLIGTDFYITKNDYPGIIGVYFEANIKLVNGNGNAYFRLFDVTHGVGITASEINTMSQSSTFVSSNVISLWEGNNHYVVQAKSLTADTAVFESGRLKIFTEN